MQALHEPDQLIGENSPASAGLASIRRAQEFRSLQVPFRTSGARETERCRGIENNRNSMRHQRFFAGYPGG